VSGETHAIGAYRRQPPRMGRRVVFLFLTRVPRLKLFRELRLDIRLRLIFFPSGGFLLFFQTARVLSVCLVENKRFY